MRLRRSIGLAAVSVVSGGHILWNWSGTHSASPQRIFEPETSEQLEEIVREAQSHSWKIRPLGSGLSPNGIAFSQESLISMALMDKVLEIDQEQQTVRVQSGIRVIDLVSQLSEHNLTLSNFASIAEQQVGGFVQVGAHGTGAKISSIDDSVIEMKLVTPALGTIHLDRKHEHFDFAKVGLGSLGFVSEIVLQCVPKHKLVEKTWILSRKEAKEQYSDLIQKFQHLKYLWIPYTDSVVVVGCNPESKCTKSELEAARKAQFIQLSSLKKLAEKLGQKIGGSESFASLRGKCLFVNPLDVGHVKAVNEAEAEFWKSNQISRIGWSHEILQFDCGDPQWVTEVCFSSKHSMQYMEELLEMIESKGIPAHAPIEQRWTAGSSSKMAVNHGKPDEVFCWVGIIMYLPEKNSDDFVRVTQAFDRFVLSCKNLFEKYEALHHWAKIESRDDLDVLRAQLWNKLPIEEFNKLRALYDPKNLLTNDLLDALFEKKG